MPTLKPFRIHIKTYGCQMNERDSEMCAVLLSRHGYALAEQESQADAVIVNTCSVRAQAEDKAIGKLRMLLEARQEQPAPYIGVAGCMVQRLKDDLFRKVPGLDFAVGPGALARMPEILGAVRSGRRGILDVAPCDSHYDGTTHAPSQATAFVNILYGCDRHCTYCVVPEVRGPEWSRRAPEIIAEVRQLIAGGVKDVTLLGQSIMAYGRRTNVWEKGNRSPRGFTEPLPRLLEALNDLKGLSRLRFTSAHPSGCSPELARAFAELSALCEHLHLPLQSAADRILKLMQRGYTVEDYRAAVRGLRQARKDIVFSTDVIVGFPTETPEEFELTRAFLEEINFDNVYIFKYNPRPGTVAARWNDDVSATEKLRRNHLLLKDQERRSRLFHQTFVGQACEALVEGVSLRNKQRWAGRTRKNILAVFEAAPGLKPGALVRVRVTRATAQALYGNVE